MSRRLCILLAAAGASSRMRGADKLLQEVDGAPLLTRQTRAALATGLPVKVTLPDNAPRRDTALRTITGDILEVAHLADAPQGMAASLRHGATWAEGIHADGMIIVLADMPEIGTNDIMKMIASFEPDQVLRATDTTGQMGHPVIFPARLFPVLETLHGDMGARDILRNETVKTIALPGRRATTDLDTPEDWDAWRTSR